MNSICLLWQDVDMVESERQHQFVVCSVQNVLYKLQHLHASHLESCMNFGWWRNEAHPATNTTHSVSQMVSFFFFIRNKNPTKSHVSANGADSGLQVNEIKYIFPFCLRHTSNVRCSIHRKRKQINWKIFIWFSQSVCFFFTPTDPVKIVTENECQCMKCGGRDEQERVY